MRKSLGSVEVKKGDKNNVPFQLPEVAPFAQVLKAENAQIWILRVGPIARAEYVLKYFLHEQHSWNQRMLLSRKEVNSDRSDWYFLTLSGEKILLLTHKKGSGLGLSYYEALIEGSKTPLKFQLDEIQSRKVNPPSFAEEYYKMIEAQTLAVKAAKAAKRKAS